ncbi:MAG: ATP-binding protein [Phenylobacterium sp.]|uniref:PAS domain-containing hybrid sensor histidine kinase/response regulator n=1 Tax=Phenylobacterium sp. TaxID=1871053 RepID=UPI0027350D50|nr:PAS domain-containing sensor histidine kinase [Phenylobacterium sp.]MDP3176071.1 ATP-binding protein [Phenylobacterium sp.]
MNWFGWAKPSTDAGKPQAPSVGSLRSGSLFGANAEAASRDAEVAEICRALVQNSPDCIEILTPEGRWEFMNERGLELLEFGSYAEIAGKEWATSFPPSAQSIVSEALVLAQCGGVARFQAPCPTARGLWKWWDVMMTPVRSADGHVERIVCTSRDISGIKQVEESLSEALKEAEQAARAKDDFLANLSHELRTPLTSILGFAELLGMRAELSVEAKGHAGRIELAGKSLLALLNDMLDLARAGAGTLRVEPAPCDLADLMTHVAELVAPLAARKPIEVSVEMDAGLEGWFELDRERVQQVVLNLVNNAIKFTDSGQVAVGVSRTGDGQGRLKFTISDTGSGIEAHVLPTLFDRFTQVDNSMARKHGGAGLGLAICKELVARMGGEIGAESRIGEGSTFWFSLPLVELAAANVDTHLEVDAGAGLKVLIADDSEANQHLLSAILRAGGHEPHIASDGIEALEALAAEPFDVVLMDIQMPRMDGLTAIGKLRRATHLNARTPVIAITANVFPEQVATYLEAGANDCVAKPFKAPEVLGKLGYWGSRPVDVVEDARIAV